METINQYAKKYAGLLFIATVILLLVLLIIWYVNYSGYLEIYDNQIEGLWIANDDFCTKSELEGLLLFIGPKIDSFLNETRRAYIIMFAENKIVLNEKLEMKISGMRIPITKNLVEKNLTIDNTNLVKFIPSDLKMSINLGEGKMMWEKDDTVYAELYKDTLSVKGAISDKSEQDSEQIKTE